MANQQRRVRNARPQPPAMPATNDPRRAVDHTSRVTACVIENAIRLAFLYPRGPLHPLVTIQQFSKFSRDHGDVATADKSRLTILQDGSAVGSRQSSPRGSWQRIVECHLDQTLKTSTTIMRCEDRGKS